MMDDGETGGGRSGTGGAARGGDDGWRLPPTEPALALRGYYRITLPHWAQNFAPSVERAPH